MRYFLTIIATLISVTTYSQVSSDMDNLGLQRETPRMLVAPYSTAQEALAADGGVVSNKFIRPVAEWQSEEQVDCTIYKSTFAYPFSWTNRLVLVHVGAVGGAYDLYLNGKFVGCTTNGFVPTEYNITKAVKDDINEIEIRCHKNHWSQTMECFDKSVSPSMIDVYVFSQPVIRVRDIVHKARIDATGHMANVEVALVVKTSSLNAKKARIHYEIMAPDTTVIEHGYRDVELRMRGEDTVKFMSRIPTSKLWSAESPTLYRINVSTQIDGRHADYQSHPVGFRELSYSDGTLSVNGVAVSLLIGDVDPSTATLQSLLDLKAAGYNTVRVGQGVVPSGFYRLCDKAGMYVIVAVPINTSESGNSRKVGGNPSNDIAWRAAYLDRVESSYRTTCDYASVVAYLLAENSSNGINLYESYLFLKGMDGLRPIMYQDSGNEWNNDVIK